MAVGLYISVPFCRTKCTYCNFASDVFSRTVFDRYLNRLCEDMSHAPDIARRMGATLEREVDSIYIGGGTPTVLDIAQLERVFVTISQNFTVTPTAEITVECAPGTLTETVIKTLQRCGVNRVSLGVQSFVDHEAASVGRLHNRATVLEEISRLRNAGIADINVDLIAGLPHQTMESWQDSLEEAIASGVPHISIYMLEIDDDSRLGRELIAGGTRYHAHFVPDEDLVADLYSRACVRLNEAGISQYEISNFARSGHQSQHNLKYWIRQPYMGFGVDAHSMLRCHDLGLAVRFATPDSLESYIAGNPRTRTVVDKQAAMEEVFFLRLRLNRGVDLQMVSAEFGERLETLSSTIVDLIQIGLLEQSGSTVRLTERGRLLSNEVFERFLLPEKTSV